MAVSDLTDLPLLIMYPIMNDKTKRPLFDADGNIVLTKVNPKTFRIPQDVIDRLKREEQELEKATHITHEVLSIEFTI